MGLYPYDLSGKTKMRLIFNNFIGRKIVDLRHDNGAAWPKSTTVNEHVHLPATS